MTAEGMTPEVTILTIFLRLERAKETFPDTPRVRDRQARRPGHSLTTPPRFHLSDFTGRAGCADSPPYDASRVWGRTVRHVEEAARPRGGVGRGRGHRRRSVRRPFYDVPLL